MRGAEETNRSERLRAEFLDIFYQSIEKARQSKKQLEDNLKGKFMKAIQKEARNNIDAGAYEVLDAKESKHVQRNKADKIVKSRYVLTAKSIEPEDFGAAITGDRHS